MLRRTVRTFRDEEIRLRVEALAPDITHLPTAEAAALRDPVEEQGLRAMGIPEVDGGSGLGILGRVLVL